MEPARHAGRSSGHASERYPSMRRGRGRGVLIGAIVALLAAATPTPGDVAFDAARTARTKSAYPHYASYTTVVRYRIGAHPMVRSWETVEDLHRRLVHARSISREETANPTYPYGTNIGLSVLGATVFVMNPARDADPIGQVSFAVDQDFGLAIDAHAIAARLSAADVASSAKVLPIIGRTGALARLYDVTLLDDVVENAQKLHHLTLRPLRDPRRNRLRELWIDAASALPVRAVVDGVGNGGPLDAVPWRVTFRQVGDGTYVARETALAPLHAGDAELDDATIDFDELAPTNALTPVQSLGFSEQTGITDP